MTFYKEVAWLNMSAWKNHGEQSTDIFDGIEIVPIAVGEHVENKKR